LSEEKKNNAKEQKSKVRQSLRPLVGLAFVSLLIGGFFFPFLMTGVGQAAFPHQANGDLVTLNGRVVGSYYVDDGFTQSIFFWTRNESNPENASASGVDPDITVGQAYAQVPRISNATGISQSELMSIVNDNTDGTFWIFGSPFVNVLNLNIKLIQQYPAVYENFTG
jgi:potassium-transporting ATPase KdpC subunit